MKSIFIVGAAALALGLATWAYAEDSDSSDSNYTVVKAPPGPPDINVKVVAPKGTSEEDIAQAIAIEKAKRDPEAQAHAQAAKEKAAEDQAHTQRMAKICESIPEKAMRDDPSLRRMCQ